MTDWIEHDGGPQPVDDGVFVEVCATVDYTVNLDDGLQLSQFAPWARKFKYRIINQHLIDAARKEGLQKGLEVYEESRKADEHHIKEVIERARLEGIRLGLEAAKRHAEAVTAPSPWRLVAIPSLDPDTIAREAVLDQLTREAQAQGMGYAKEADQ